MNSRNGLLLASLALNIAVLSGLAVHAFDHGRHERRDAPSAMGGRGAMFPHPMLLRRALSDERRAVAEAVMQEHREDIRGSLRALADARADVHAAMAAEPFDRAALDRAFVALRERDAQAATEVQAMLAELMVELTPEERAAVVEGMQRRRPERPRDR